MAVERTSTADCITSVTFRAVNGLTSEPVSSPPETLICGGMSSSRASDSSLRRAKLIDWSQRNSLFITGIVYYSSVVDVGNGRLVWKGREMKEVRWCVCLWRERTVLCCKYCDCVSGECGWSVGRTGEGYSCVVVLDRNGNACNAGDTKYDTKYGKGIEESIFSVKWVRIWVRLFKLSSGERGSLFVCLFVCLFVS